MGDNLTVDVSLYRKHTKPLISAILIREPDAHFLDLAGRVAIGANCHIIAVCYYIAEMQGMTPDLEAFIGRLMTFYNVDTVIGVDSGN